MSSFDDLASNMQDAGTNIMHNLPFVVGLIAIVWIIHFINYCVHYRLNQLGIYPRRLRGLIGIVASPWLHGSGDHLFFNSVPFFILSSLLISAGRTTFAYASVIIILISGSLTWLFGRRALHVGASGVVIGYWGYLLMAAYHQRSFVTIGLAIMCIYYFAGFFLSMVPGEEKVSWEGHLFGFVAGLAANYLTPIAMTYVY